MNYSSNLTSKGQVTVPAKIRRRLGLKPGEPVRFRVNKANQVIIEKNSWKDDLTELHKEVVDQLRKRGITALRDEELDQLIDQSAAAAVREEGQQEHTDD